MPGIEPGSAEDEEWRFSESAVIATTLHNQLTNHLIFAVQVLDHKRQELLDHSRPTKGGVYLDATANLFTNIDMLPLCCKLYLYY